MKLYKKLTFLVLLVGIFLLTGCGIEVSTDLSLQEGFQGTRTITCYVSNQDLKGYFKGDVATIDDIIEKNCPDCFSYQKKALDKGYQFLFTLSFSSLDEYKSQVSSVLNFSPEITFQYTDSLFSNSISLKENFSSKDLLCWFEILLKEEYNLSDSKITSLWEMKDSILHWNEKTYKSTSDNLTLSESKQFAFDGIELYTEEKEDRSFARKLVFKIPKETLDTEVLNLQKSFQKITPKDASGTWTGTKTGKNYEIVFTASDFSSLSDTTNEILSGTKGKGTSSFTFADYQIFKFRTEQKETLSFSRFLSTKDNQVSVTYYYKPSSFTETNVAEMQQKVNNSFTGTANKKGYYLLYKGTCDSLSLRYLGDVVTPVDSYSVTTNLLEHGQFQRTFQFRYQDIYTKDEMEYLLTFFQKNQTSKWNVAMEKGILTITQTGTPENLNEVSRLFFGSDDNTIQYQKDHTIFSSTASTHLEEIIDLSRFLGDANKETAGTYHFQADASETLRKFSMDSNHCQVSIKSGADSNSYEAEISGNRFFVNYEGNVYYGPGVLLLMAAVVVLVLLLLFFIKRNPMKGTNNRKKTS